MATDAAEPSFVEFNRRLAAMPAFEEPSPKSSRRARLGLATSLLAYALTILVAQLPLRPGIQLGVMLFLLAWEIAGIVINVWNSREEFLSLRNPLHNYAQHLDHDRPYHVEMIEWLASWPREALLQHAAMSRFRRDRMAQKMPLVLGSIDKLGVVPVVIAIYFQAREYLAGRHIGIAEGVFAFVAAGMYIFSWIAALTKSRLDLMDMYLQEAVSVQDGEIEILASPDGGAQEVPQSSMLPAYGMPTK